MTPDLSALPDTTAILVNVVLLIGVLIASVRGWFASTGKDRSDARAARPGEDRALLEVLATILSDRSATANLAQAARDIAHAVGEAAESLDRIERKIVGS